MNKTIQLMLFVFLFINCKKENSASENSRMELVPEPDKELRLEYERKQKLLENNCKFLEPDTSICGIKIHDVESTLRVLGQKTELEGDSTHVFFSKDKNQELRLNVFPGGARSQVSIFNVCYSKNKKQNLRMINQNVFETEKEVKLGISKNQLIEKLGKCYTVKDSTKQTIELDYRIENPNDSRTKLLENYNMPVYYAWYKFKNEKLDSFEFGFEYP
jgi:hypothetical protein